MIEPSSAIITGLILLISVTGIVLLLILVSRIYQVNKEFNLKRFRSKKAGFSDLINYAAMVDDGIIVGKNGSFMAAWIYSGEDSASNTGKQREMVSFRINQALSKLGNGWMIHVDAVRQHAPDYPNRELSSFPDPITEGIEEERRRLFEKLGTMYEGHFVLTVTWFPPLLAERQFQELMFDDDQIAPDKTKRTFELISQFKQEIDGIESRLTAVLKLDRLKGQKMVLENGDTIIHDDFLRWLQFCVTGKNHPVILPSNPMYLDAVIGGEELWVGVVPKIGRKFIQVVAIDGFPFDSTPGILNSLSEQPCEYRWSTRFIFMDHHEAIRSLEKYRKKWKQKVRGFFDQVFNNSNGRIDQDALSMVNDAEAAIAEINSGLVSAGYYTSVIVLMHENRKDLKNSSIRIEKEINRLGFSARVETINTMDAYLGSLPGHGVENVRRPLNNTMNLADLIPTSSIWTGSVNAPCPMYPPLSPPLMQCVTNGSTPFRFNLHIRDLGHTLMFGPTRSGKSTHLGLIVAQLRRYKGMSLYVFDKGLSMYPLTKATGGNHFTVAASDSRLSFCPLQFLKTKEDRAWAMEWIDTLLSLNGVQTTPLQRNEIGVAIVSMNDNDARTMSEFSLTVQDLQIREALKQYTVDGIMGHLLDAEKDGLDLSNFTTFEVEELMDLGEKYALPVLLYLFRRIEKSLKGQPAAIIIDEAWIMLAHPVFRDKIREWLKAFAKKNCLVLLATQSLTDASNSGILDVIVESTATKIFLPNVFARDEDTAILYRRMGLNNRQIDIIATALPKRQYYCTSEAGRRLYELRLGSFALAFVGATDLDSIATIKKLENSFGDKWTEEWLKLKNINLADYLEDAHA